MTEDAGRLRVASALEATGAYDGPLDLDLGNLAASDPSPIDPDVFGRKPSDVATAAALARGRDVLQRLVGDLFTLPSEADVNGRYVELPAGTTYFPRTKPLPPQEKPMTKWEKFAKEKGIKKRKRSKLVYDEQTDEWKRRHGYDRVKDADRIIIADAKMSDVPGKTEDPFSKEERERRERVEKNAGKQVKNLQKAVASHGKHVLPPTLQMSAAPKKGVKALPLNGMKKQQIKDLTAQVAISTASMAKYNAPIPGQFIFIFGNFWQWSVQAMLLTSCFVLTGDEKIKTRGKRRQFDSVTDTGTEREKAQGYIDRLVRREADFTVDVNMAARKIQRAKEAENRSAKKQKLAEKGEFSLFLFFA